MLMKINILIKGRIIMSISRLVTCITILATTLIISACGITASSLQSDPGYAPLEFPSIWKADSNMRLSLGPAALRLVLFITDDDANPELRSIIRHLKGIRIRSYNVESNFQEIVSRVEQSAGQLSSSGWERIVSVNKKTNVRL
jgi:Domain of unknown function (DUF4252)